MDRHPSSRKSDFEQFNQNPNFKAPDKLKDGVRQSILTRLQLNIWTFSAKLALAYGSTGLLSLSVCHQFGLNPFNTKNSLSDWLMSLGGHTFCMSLCGMFFVMTSLGVASFLLSEAESKFLFRSKFLISFLLSIASLGFFAAFGAELVFKFALVWILGAYVGGLLLSYWQQTLPRKSKAYLSI